MGRIVRKYGGSSLKDEESIRHVARQIADLKWQGNEVVVVVSAMAVTTDDLVKLARSLHDNPPRREMDMLLSVGERISCALLALAIEAEGIGAISYTGSQVGIITDTRHGEARIVDIRPTRLVEALEKEQVVVVAGFQGVSIEKEITTLGRGGSDSTAVALAAAINADRCELMKEVDGLYTANPLHVKDAVLLEQVTYDRALKLAKSGTVALQAEAARLASQHNVKLGIGNTESSKIGTIITDGPLDCGEIIGLARIDGLTYCQRLKPLADYKGYYRQVEFRNRWQTWYQASDGGKGELSSVSIVTAGRYIPELYSVVHDVLRKTGAESHGSIQQQDEYWICVETAVVDKVLADLHAEFMKRGWIRSCRDEEATV